MKNKLGTINEIAQKIAFLKLEVGLKKIFKQKPKTKMKKYIKFSDVKNKVIEKIPPKKQNMLYFFLKAIAKAMEKGAKKPPTFPRLTIKPKTNNKQFKIISFLFSISLCFKSLYFNKNSPLNIFYF